MFTKIIKTHFFPLLLTFIAGIIAGANYTAGTFLTGWDTLHPEFDFGLAFYRMLTGVWRSDQGLGTVAIQSHMAELPRVAFLWLTSFVLPISTLRYVSFLLSLAVGVCGVYYLTRHLLEHDKRDHHFPSFFAGLAYLTNLVTIQHFVVPLEMFAIHYALVPWLFLTATRLLETGKRHWILIFAAVTFFASPQAHTATLFYAYFMLLCVYLATYVILHTSTWKQALGRALLILGVTVSINAYWMLPNIYAAITHGNDVRTSAVNQLFSDDAFAKTESFGTVENAPIGKNFLFDWQLVDPTTGKQIDVLGPWIAHLKRPMVLPYYYMLFALAVIGILSMLREKNARAMALMPVFIASFAVLLNGTWPISYLFNRVASISPLLQEVLRFSFTKFSVIYIVTLSVFMGCGLTSLFKFIRMRGATIALSMILFIYAVYAFFPALTGNLVSPAMRISIPTEYFQMFSWFRQKDWNSRVAILPIHSFWNWANYSWGYQGAGFLQFGIPQPILDRDYDRWSPYNENYYWEMSRAVYAKDATSVERVLSKYTVRYLLLDESIISRENNRSIYTPELKTMLNSLWNVKEVARFGALTLYEKIDTQNALTVSLKSNLPTISPSYKWTENDVTYARIGDYIATGEPSTINNQQSTHTYPFRSLFTKRSVGEREFTITETPDTITIGSKSEATGASILKANQTVYDSTKSADLVAGNVQQCGVLRDGTATAQNVDQFLRFTSRNQRGCLSFGVGSLLHRDGYLVAVASRHIAGRPLLFSLINQTAKHVELEVYLNKSKVNDNEWQTDYFVLPPLAPDGLGYTVYLSNDAIGRQASINDIASIKFYRIPYQELVTLRSPNTQPQGRALSVDVDIVSHPNPAYYRVSFQPSAISGQPENTTLVLSQSFDPGWKAYVIKSCQLSAVSCQLKNKVQELLPFLFGTEIKDHVLVNNWENGWRLPEAGINTNYPIIQLSNNPIQDGKSRSNEVTNNQRTIVLFFLPQLLQWFGFALLPIPFIIGIFWVYRNE